MPRFVDKPLDLELDEATSPGVHLSCCVEGLPQPEVKWLHNGKALTPTLIYLDREVSPSIIGDRGGECVAVHNGPQHQLEIRNARKEKHQGTYTAVATNLYGDAHSSAEVKFKAQAKTEDERAGPGSARRASLPKG